MRKIGEEIGEKIGHCYFCNRSKMHHLGVTQPDYQTLWKPIFHSFKYIKRIEYNDVK